MSHRIELLVETSLVPIRRSSNERRFGLFIGGAKNRAKVGVEGRSFNWVAILYWDRERFDTYVSPLLIVKILRFWCGAKLDLVDIGGVRPAGSKGPSNFTVVADGKHGRAD